MSDASEAAAGIQVCVRVRPLHDRERSEGYRNCVSFDETTKQVVLSAVDRGTLVQLRGQAAKGYAFDRRYGPEATSDSIYDDCITHMVDNLFKGYNATVLAYGQTGSGKTLTMSGGVGIHGTAEKGIIRRAAEHILGSVAALRLRLKPGEAVSVRAYALELYNEELRDLSSSTAPAAAAAAADGGASDSRPGSPEPGCVRIAERPCGNGRCVPEVVGVSVVEVCDADALVAFFGECFERRAVCATRMNDRSSRSHAIYTVLLSRTLVDVSDSGDKVRTTSVESRFNLVDLAGSERVKRSGATGTAFREAVHINAGLLALGNVIVALSGGPDAVEPTADGGAGSPEPGGRGGPATVRPARHVPYRDSKLTRLLQDSLGGNALTALISCVSCCEADFEETNSTLKYANRACRIKNQPLPNKQLLLEEDLLPLLPANSGATSGMSMIQMQALLAEHSHMKEVRERREGEKREKEEKRLAELRGLREAEKKAPGFQRLRMAQYDDLRKKLVSSHGGRALGREVITDDTLASFRKPTRDEDGEMVLSEPGAGSSAGSRGGPSYLRPTTASSAGGGKKSAASRPASARVPSGSHLASVYGSGSGGRSTNGSARSSPVPWESGNGSRSATPDILMVEGAVPEEGEQGEDAGQQQGGSADGSGSGSRSSNSSSNSGAATPQAGSRPGSASRRGRPGRSGAGPRTAESATGTDADGGAEGSWQPGLLALKTKGLSVDEGTCMSPRAASDAIKACYGCAAADADTQPEPAAPGASCAAATAATAAAAAAAVSSCAPASRTTAFDVLEFQRGSAAAAAAPPGDGCQSPGSSRNPADGRASGEQPPAAAAPPPPQLLARFRVNTRDTLAVFQAVSAEDFADVAALLPPNTALPAPDKMTYLLARLEMQPQTGEQLAAALDRVGAGVSSMAAAVGPPVGCLMATFGTSLITDCIFDFEDPEQLAGTPLQQRLELWGLQIPHTSLRPALGGAAAAAAAGDSPEPGASPRRHGRSGSSSSTAAAALYSSAPGARGGSRPATPASPEPGRHSGSAAQLAPQPQPGEEQQQAPQLVPAGETMWSSTDRLNVSIGLMFALCNLAAAIGTVAGFCVPRPQLLRRWLQAGVKMKQVCSPTKLIYPSTAHDYSYYKASTIAYFIIEEVAESLARVLSVVPPPA